LGATSASLPRCFPGPAGHPAESAAQAARSVSSQKVRSQGTGIYPSPTRGTAKPPPHADHKPCPAASQAGRRPGWSVAEGCPPTRGWDSRSKPTVRRIGTRSRAQQVGRRGAFHGGVGTGDINGVTSLRCVAKCCRRTKFCLSLFEKQSCNICHWCF